MSSSASNFGNSISQKYSRSNSWDSRFRIEWQPDSLWNIMFRPQFNYNSSDDVTNDNSATFSADPYSYEGITDPLEGFQLSRLIAAGIVKNRNMSNAIGYTDSKSLGGWVQVTASLARKAEISRCASAATTERV